eukprot:119668_1
MTAIDLLGRLETEREQDSEEENHILQPGAKSTKHKYNALSQTDAYEPGNKLKHKPSKRDIANNGYHTIDVVSPSNPFDEVNNNFVDTPDPESYIGVYTHIKQKIQLIRQNIDSISRLRDKFNLSDSQKQYEPIMNGLDDIMMDNSRLTREIKKALQVEKQKNDKLALAPDHRSSSVLQWRVNQLNACVRHFKSCAADFERELSETQKALKQKEKRKLREFDENGELDEEKINFMVDNPDKLELFLQKKFEGMAAADALLERVHELEDRHQGMMKIEKSIKELHELWMELNIMVTEQQEHLDRVQANVEQTRDYVNKATKNLKSAEKKQKSSRKLACCALCLFIFVAIILVVWFGGFLKF